MTSPTTQRPVPQMPAHKDAVILLFVARAVWSVSLLLVVTLSHLGLGGEIGRLAERLDRCLIEDLQNGPRSTPRPLPD